MDSDNSLLFFKLFKNNVIRSNIFRYLKLYNNHMKDFLINPGQDVLSYPYIEYFNSVRLYVTGDLVEVFNTINYIIKMTDGKCKFDLSFCESQFQNNEEGGEDESEHEEGGEGAEEEEKVEKEEKEINNNEKPVLKVPINIVELIKILYGQYYQVIEDETLLKLSIELKSFSVEFEYQLNQENIIPECVESIFDFNQKLKYLPSKLKHLYLSNKYDQEFGDSENQIKLDGLKTLVLENSIKEIKKDTLPATIETLRIYTNISNLLSTEWLPSRLKDLTLSNLTVPLDENSLLLLNNLENLTLCEEFNSDFLFNSDKCLLPSSLKKLVFLSPFKSKLSKHSFPENLEILKFKHKHYYLNIQDDDELTRYIEDNLQLIEPNILPNKIKSLRLQYNQRISTNESIPSSVTKIKNINSIEQLKLLPSSVTDVVLSYKFNTEIKQGDVPGHISKLTFGKEFYHHFKKDSLFDNEKLKSIRFKGPAPLFEKDSLPSTFEHLEFHYSHGNIPILPGNLPFNLKSFILPNQMYSKNLMCAPACIPNLLATKLQCTYPPFKPSKFPDCLQILCIHSNDPIKLFELPKSLKYLFIIGSCKLITPVPSSLMAIYSSNSDFIFQNTHPDVVNLLTVIPTIDKFENHFRKLIYNL